MSRNRIAVAVGVLAVFVVVGGILVYAGSRHGSQHRTFDVKVFGGKVMVPSILPAYQYDAVTINVTSDTNGEVHLHVYDITFEAKAGQTVSHTFKADKTCTCDIEWESTSTGLGQLQVNP